MKNRIAFQGGMAEISATFKVLKIAGVVVPILLPFNSPAGTYKNKMDHGG